GQGVVHRDLTPSNILIERGSGRVVTTDFGLASIARSTGSLTGTGGLLGTPEYWSPELALGRENGAAADLYALGCILFLLLSGRLPFAGEARPLESRARSPCGSKGRTASPRPGVARTTTPPLCKRSSRI